MQATKRTLQNQKIAAFGSLYGDLSNPVEAAEGCDLCGTENIQHVRKIRKSVEKKGLEGVDPQALKR
ncbi:hypothetical protein J3D54_001695 [Pseudomonas sp. GGS8]|nr:hypothetical protein [Pseudomonas sp. GGS8]